MAGVEFITAFVLDHFEIRILGYEVTVSPTVLLNLDEELCLAFETHHGRLRRIIDGFHVLESDKVSPRCILFIIELACNGFTILLFQRECNPFLDFTRDLLHPRSVVWLRYYCRVARTKL